MNEKFEAPRVSDGCIHRVLNALLVLDGDRLSYRALDVEQVGSVYQAMMGYAVERAFGRSIAVRPKHIVISLDELLEIDGAERKKWLKDQADSDLTGAALKALKEAATAEEAVAALGRRVSPRSLDAAGTPRLMAPGTLYLQPGEERRRTGSHYTPRELTEPIVRTTLRPVLEALGERPTPEQILDLKVCDPAMGSGAFLVEACRQLGDALVDAWHSHDAVPVIPRDEDEVTFARRLIAQRCLYGVDRNPVAVDLAKISLWLVTLAKDHALTFVDHALRHGDSLVGLSREQIESFHWDPDAPGFEKGFEAMEVREHAARVAKLRRRIREADETASDSELRNLWDEAQLELGKVRLFGDLVLAAFFDGKKAKDREAKRSQYATAVLSGEAETYRSWLEEWRRADRPLAPFHWQIEFPEVFERENAGFDAIVGNPPFMGGSRISASASRSYADYLGMSFEESKGKSDLVAYFFRQAFSISRTGGAFGLVATNTVRQGATRYTGLRWIRGHRGWLYSATRRLRWPGSAGGCCLRCTWTKGRYVHALRS